jgi:hypothetical protein
VQSRKLVQHVIAIGLIAGLLDITAATTQFLLSGGKNPVQILLFIASGIYGKEAFAGGTGMAIVGFLLHMFNAMAFTVFFFLVYPRLKAISENRYLWTIFYGAFVWMVMNRIVIPLSNITQREFNLRSAAIGMAILIVFIALPIVIGAQRHYGPKQ